MNPPTVGPSPADASPFDVWVAQSRELLALTDDAGRIDWCNPAWSRAFGVDAGAELLDLAPADWADGAPRAVLAAGLRDARCPGDDIELRAADGTPHWVAPRVTGIDRMRAWSCAEAGQRRALEARARQLGELLDAVAEIGRIGIWQRDLVTGQGHWDRQAFALFGLDPRRGVPTREEVLVLVHPDDRNGALLARNRFPGRYDHRFRVLRPDGSLGWLRAHWEVRHSATGVPERSIGVVVDETAAEALARSHDAAAAGLRLVSELANVAIWRHDFATDRIRYDEHGLRVLELPPAPNEMSLEEARTLTHPDDVPRLVASAAHALATGQPIDVQVRHRRRAGGWRDLLVRRVIEHGPDGKPRGFVGIALDIGAQVEQSRRAERLAVRLEAATRGARLGVWSAAANGDSIEWNDQMYRLFDAFEAPALPTLAAWLEQGVHAEDRERVARGIRAYLAGPVGAADLEYRTQRRDGSVRWMIGRADLDPSGAESSIIGITMDVTERHAARAALHAAGTRVALIARQAGIGTWQTGLDGGTMIWDEQMWELRGLTPQAKALDTEARLALVHPDDRGGLIDAALSPGSVSGATAYEFRVLHPDGHYRWLASRSTALRDAHGKMIGRVGVNWDITDARNSELARQKALLAERESQAKSTFLARMSHELRTPLNAVLGFAELLEAEARRSLAVERATTLGHIRTAGEHLLTLIDDAFDWSQLENDALRLDISPVAARFAVEQALPLVADLARRHEVTLVSGLLDGTLHADPTRLRQVLLNLLTNAIKYNRPGGRVTVDVVRDPTGELRLRVADTGRGIRPEQLPELFEPFNRLGVEGEGIQGSGIGLTIVKALVEAMDGRIEVRSTLGEGTVFEVILPSATAPAPAPAADAHAEPHATSTPRTPPGLPSPSVAPLSACAAGRLLYIEDNAVNLLLVAELVKLRPNLTLLTATDGASGVAAAQARAPDLVLVDMQLPDFDGFEVLRRLREDPRTAGLRCIALSANTMPDDMQRARELGFDDYWTKPVRFQPFLRALDRLLPSK